MLRLYSRRFVRVRLAGKSSAFARLHRAVGTVLSSDSLHLVGILRPALGRAGGAAEVDTAPKCDAAHLAGVDWLGRVRDQLDDTARPARLAGGLETAEAVQKLDNPDPSQPGAAQAGGTARVGRVVGLAGRIAAVVAGTPAMAGTAGIVGIACSPR